MKNWKLLLALCVSIDFDRQIDNFYWNKFDCAIVLSLSISAYPFLSYEKLIFFSQAEKNYEPDTKWSYVSKSSNKRALYTNIVFNATIICHLFASRRKKNWKKERFIRGIVMAAAAATTTTAAAVIAAEWHIHHQSFPSFSHSYTHTQIFWVT